jgi:3-dehydroquinate dehydratase/shikimate dehydrogenase
MNEFANNARLCVSVAESTARRLEEKIVGANAAADVIELRLDHLPRAEFDAARRRLNEILAARRSSFIITLRARDEREPGARENGLQIDEAERFEFWREDFVKLIRANPTREILGDIEFDLVKRLAQENVFDDELWWRVICSHHNFEGVPPNLDAIFDALKATPARILKIAVAAQDAADCISVFQLLKRAHRELKPQGREMIALAMSAGGLVTRILSPAHGAFLTYAALEESKRTAPGQITARAMRDLYRVKEINAQTQVFGLIGAPVAHSLSPQIHNAALREKRTDGVYIPFETRDVDLFFARMANPKTREMDWQLRGLSVTAPHKQAVLKHLDWLDEAAREIGAVNTIVIEDDEMRGFNTDADAALAPLAQFQTDAGIFANLRFAVLGAGGAARAVVYSLSRRGARVCIFARSIERGAALAREFAVDFAPLDENVSYGDFDVAINATPLGTRGASETKTPATASQLTGAQIVYDLVYNPAETRFMREGRAAGCRVIGGLEMLVAQAAAQFKLWTGADAPIDLMRAAAQQAIAN